MYRKNNSLFKLFFTVGILTLPLGAVAIKYITESKITKADDNYVINFNSSNRLTSSTTFEGDEEKSAIIQTGSGNSIELRYKGVVTNEDGWQVIKPNGYIYNPVVSTSNKNSLNGISSITGEITSGFELEYYVGWGYGETDIMYMHVGEVGEENIHSLQYLSHNYFKIINESEDDIVISNMTLQYTCEEGHYPINNLNILMIGNSFADDTIRFVKQIAGSYGINVNIFDAYIASCTLDQHYNNWVNETASYSYRYMDGDNWVYSDNRTLQSIVDEHEWDLVTFQQASQYVGDLSSYSHLEDLVSFVNDRVEDEPAYYWNQTWSYTNDYMFNTQAFAQYNNDSDTMYEAIIEAERQCVDAVDAIEGIIPAGTAVQNMRTSYLANSLSRDGLHMSFTHGRYLLGLNFVRAVLGINFTLSPCRYIPEGVNESFLAPAYEAVENAFYDYEMVTESSYKISEMENYDLTDYTEIDAGMIGCSYWNSTDSTNYGIHINNTSGTSNLYVASKRFTSTTLPVGSLVFVPEGFGFRPEGWKTDGVQSSRPDERHDNVYEITESFWDGYLARAFNFFKEGKSSLLGLYDEIFQGVKFFVPTDKLNSEIIVEGNNNFYTSDKNTFESKGYDIDQFERLDLDPITGFYKCDSYSNLQNSYVDDTAKKFICTRAFYTNKNELPENTVIIVDSGFQWRSDCWGAYSNTASRPANVSASWTMLDSSFMSSWRLRTFNVSSTSSQYVDQNALTWMDHLRIYVPKGEITPIEASDKVTMTVLGRATISGAATALLGESVPIVISLGGEGSVKVTVNGNNAGATGYVYKKDTGAISINTTGSASGYTYGKITGVVDVDNGSINNLKLDGTLKTFVGDNGSITCSEVWGDRFNYASNSASQLVWQRWYGSSWTANSGTGDWTSSNSTYKLEEEHSMGLRIAGTTHSRTSFTLKSDFNGGAGITVRGISIWIYNASTTTYSGDSFRVFGYKTASTISGDHAVPGSSFSTLVSAYQDIAPGQWTHLETGFTETTIYNIRLFFSAISSDNIYIYVGHISLY